MPPQGPAMPPPRIATRFLAWGSPAIRARRASGPRGDPRWPGRAGCPSRARSTAARPGSECSGTRASAMAARSSKARACWRRRQVKRVLDVRDAARVAGVRAQLAPSAQGLRRVELAPGGGGHGERLIERAQRIVDAAGSCLGIREADQRPRAVRLSHDDVAPDVDASAQLFDRPGLARVGPVEGTMEHAGDGEEGEPVVLREVEHRLGRCRGTLVVALHSPGQRQEAVDVRGGERAVGKAQVLGAAKPALAHRIRRPSLAAYPKDEDEVAVDRRQRIVGQRPFRRRPTRRVAPRVLRRTTPSGGGPRRSCLGRTRSGPCRSLRPGKANAPVLATCSIASQTRSASAISPRNA